ncbi:Rib/alpha-like domain-containing protein, partial [Lactobacillus psittaci]|uniref:Rib/alpha-like domain-containing protein n=2 Tax=Lactobacillus psittaci TaxID=116089 RepID=UPI000481DD63
LNDPTTKVPVKDKDHITPEDKDKVIKNVKDANPGKDITDISVDEDGTFHGKVNGHDVTIPGEKTVYEKGDDDDTKPEGQDVNTNEDGSLPDAKEAIKNLPDLPSGTDVKWGDGASEKAKGLKPGESTTVPVVVTIPGKGPQTVQVTVTRPKPTPTPVDPETQGVNTDNDGNLPDAKEAIKNLPDLPKDTKVDWGEGAKDKAKGLKPGESTTVPVVVTIPGKGPQTVQVTVTRPKSTPTPTPTPAPKSDADTYGVETQPVKTDDHGKLPAADEGIKNLKDLPSGTHTKWGKGAQETVDQMKPGETKGIPATVEFPDGSKKDITISVTKVVVNHDSGNDSGNNSDDNNSKSDNNNNSATDNNSNNSNSNANANKANTTNNSKSQTSGNRNLNNNSSRHANKFDQVNADKLPQTGEKNEESVLSVLGMALLGLAGVALLKKKKED